MSGPEVEITCDECRSQFDTEPAVCASCFEKSKKTIEDRDRDIANLRAELEESQEETAGARSALEDALALNDDLQKTNNRLLEEIHKRGAA